MQHSLSTYLHLLRTAAAFGVVLGHSRFYYFPELGFLLGGHAQAGVAMFFVLSGFVIRYVTTTRENDGQSYARARLSRMYSVVPLAIVLTLLLDAAGTRIAPEFYSENVHYNAHTSLFHIAANLSFTNEIWFQHSVVGSNEPFWSLGFEVPYYLIAGLWLYTRGLRRITLVIASSLLIGPKILLYLPMWIAGAIAYDFISCGRAAKLPKSTGIALLFLSISGYLCLKINIPGVVNAYHFENVRQMLQSAAWFYIVGALTIMNLVGFSATFGKVDIWPAKLKKFIAWAAGGSFTLYLTHQPIMLLGLAVFPGARQGGWHALVLLIGIVSTAYLFAELGERRKETFDRAIARSLTWLRNCANTLSKKV